jgi:hypothetical protein
MTREEENDIRKNCGLTVDNVRISYEQFAECVRDSDEAGPWYEEYKRRKEHDARRLVGIS